MEKYASEFIGTFVLASLVYLSLSADFVLPTPVLAALCLTMFVYTIGGISGAHINPAVTLGLFSVRKIEFAEVLKYLLAQMLAAFLAVVAVNAMGLSPQETIGNGGTREFMAEFAGMAVFAFGIAAAVRGNAPGFVVGGSLLLGIAVSALMGSAGILNPAVAMVLGVFNPVYVTAQILGAIAGFQAYTFLDRTAVIRKKTN